MPDREQVVLNERYELERRVGRGGMAEVFLARDRLLDRPVAIKILFPEFATDPSFVARFRREAQSAANLNHPNIVAVYDWGKERGTYYIVMEYVDGRTVSDILRADGTIAPDRAAGIAADVAAALDFAHRNGVVHRDVKPGNVLITERGEVKVADFGIARAMTPGSEENLTQTGSVMGTATYFSPEQALGRPVDPRSDLYSLGVVLYEMSAGKPPFQADSPVATAYKHVQEPLPPLRDAVPDVPEGYEAITVKALAKEADQRYQAAGELRADLLRFRGGNPVGAAGVLAAPLPGPPTAATNAATAAVLRSADATSVTPTVSSDDDGSKRRNGWFFVATVVLLAVLAGLLYLFADLVGVFDDDAEQGGPVDQVEEVAQVAVVEVVGQEEAAAIAALTDQGLEVAEPTREPSSQPEGRVIGQDPAAGTEVDEGSMVAITVSTGPEEAFLPNVIGGDLDEATFEIRGAGFTGDITTEQRESDAEPDSVVGQEPPAGTHPVDQDVLLLLAVPPETTTTTAPPPTTTTEPPPETTTTTEPPPETTTTTAPPETTTTTAPPETTTTTEPPPETTTTTAPPETTTTTEPPPETTTTTAPPETTTTTEPPPDTTTTEAP